MLILIHAPSYVKYFYLLISHSIFCNGFMTSATIPFITFPGHRFCFVDIYLDSYFLEI